jgi:hypothetical protein
VILPKEIFRISTLPNESISTTFTPAVNLRIKSLFFYKPIQFIISPSLYPILPWDIILNKVENRTLQTKRFEEKASFKGAGNSTLPLASTLHSYVPTIIFKEQFLH